MKKLPLSIQTFRDFIKEDYIYVDKTKHIYDLFAWGGKYYFLSRPRRFGKSLLISTLAEIFSGNKELFKGLWIYDKIEWTKHPVIHIDLSKMDFETPPKLKDSLKQFLHKTAIFYGVTLEEKNTYKGSFVELIEKLYSLGRVVILVDEYDKPITEHLEAKQIEKAKNIRKVLKNFFGIIKGSDAYLKLVFITGVSKFSRVSIFSDLNNLRDITLSEQFSLIVGYTENELMHYFQSYLEQLAEKTGINKTQLAADIKYWYNGYSWDGTNFVYNPFSILNLFAEKRFRNFWFTSGTPTFLINLIRSKKSEIREFENLTVENYTFDSYDIENMDIAALLFQTGYLTIKKIIIENNEETYYLSYPNKEVKDSFLSYLLGEFSRLDLSASTLVQKQINKAISAGDMEGFLSEIRSLFASIPYHIFIADKEAYYHSIIYLILKLAGGDVRCEVPTNTGRIDAVLEAGDKIYIMEFKLGSEREALTQIKEMKYYEPYLGKGKEIVLMGIGFDLEQRNIGNYLVERVKCPPVL
ncbi:MAG TPA: AAA family ATPase [Candidatus Deferrimicrobium sp.]|nr:AAA family ATPase [Candidatus Kapabacteria bacterium]HLP59876.1 AAA family ATPase [Candidatus Deferrimicrobium sp.]